MSNPISAESLRYWESAMQDKRLVGVAIAMHNTRGGDTEALGFDPTRSEAHAWVMTMARSAIEYLEKEWGL